MVFPFLSQADLEVPLTLLRDVEMRGGSRIDAADAADVIDAVEQARP